MRWSTYDGVRSRQDQRVALDGNFSLCLSTNNSAAAPGTSVVLARCNTTVLSVTWLFDELLRLRPGHAPTMCAQAEADGSVKLRACSAASSQAWRPTVPGASVEVVGYPRNQTLTVPPQEWIPFLSCDFDSLEREWAKSGAA